MRNDELSGLCRGLAHELSNILTYLLPSIQDVQDFHQHLQKGAGEAPAAVFQGDFTSSDVERLGRQLELAGTRLQQLFADLRLGFQTLQRGPLLGVDLRAALREAAARTPGPPPIELDDRLLLPGGGEAAGPVLVAADAALLGEGLGRILRAAVTWAQSMTPAPAVRLSLHRLPGEPPLVQLRAHLPGQRGRGPSPENLLDMLCPSETGAVRAARGVLGILIGVHVFRLHGGAVRAEREGEGVSLLGELPLQKETDSR